MRFKIISVVLFPVLFAAYGFGQTAEGFKEKYGSKTYFEVRPKILMSAEYDKNGQVCRVLFQPNRMSKKTNTMYVGHDTLDLIELEEAFEEIVPAQQRKDVIKNNGSIFSSRIFNASFSYEEISVGLTGSLRTNEKSRRVDFCNISGENGKKSLFCSAFGAPEFVTVVWTKRTCVEE